MPELHPYAAPFTVWLTVEPHHMRQFHSRKQAERYRARRKTPNLWKIERED